MRSCACADVWDFKYSAVKILLLKLGTELQILVKRFQFATKMLTKYSPSFHEVEYTPLAIPPRNEPPNFSFSFCCWRWTWFYNQESRIRKKLQNSSNDHKRNMWRLQHKKVYNICLNEIDKNLILIKINIDKILILFNIDKNSFIGWII